MPSTMIHLAIALAVEAECPIPFAYGCFAPDHWDDRTYKDRIHLRNVPDRLAALTSLAQLADPADPYIRGWFCHLFADWCWDEGLGGAVLKPGRNPEAFSRYRAEIHSASAHLYHTDTAVHGLWQRVLAAAPQPSAIADGPTASQLMDFCQRIDTGHRAMNSDPSAVFPPETVNAYVRETAEHYRQWLSGLHFERR